jgi:Cu/Ag efflux protein CusF
MKSIIHSTKSLLAVLGAASLMGSTAFAANPHRTLRERGMIESVDTEGMKLTVKDARSHEPQVFVWNGQTKFLERHHLLGKSRTVTAEELKQGDRVSICYEKTDDQPVAKMIVITAEHQAAARPTQHNPS